MPYLNSFTNINKTPFTELTAIDDWARLERFLILGSEEGVYYAQQTPHVTQNLQSVKACLRSDGSRVIQRVLDVATSGRAPKKAPALEVLALASSSSFASPSTNAAALAALQEVARTGADLLTFAMFVDGVRGWGRGLRSAVANWYVSKPAGELAYQIMTQPAVENWKHADLIRLSHPKAETPALNAVFQWAVDGVLGHLATADIRHGELRHVYAFEQVNKATSESEVVRWIEDVRLTHELVPREWKQSAAVWEVLLENMPYPVMVSQLGKMTEVGLLVPQSAATALVVARLMDRKRVANAKIDPFRLLFAWLEYRQGNGLSNILNALEDAFYLAFDNIEAPDGNIYLAIDPGAPVHWTAAVAMFVARGGGKSTVGTMHDRLRHVNIGSSDRLDAVCQAIGDRSRRLSDSPIAWMPIDEARGSGLVVDAFIILTDKLSWADDHSPATALREYRRATGIPAKLVVVAMSPDNGVNVDHSGLIVDELHIAGFDPSVPAVIGEFLRM
jgi:60 kDa SS-A/Ro ribonucleoprotein